MKLSSSMSLMCLLGVVLLFSTGCSAIFPGGPTLSGVLYSEVTSPAQNLAVALDGEIECIKTGVSGNMSILWLFAFGDGGLNAAMKHGGITRVHHVDHTVQHVLLGLFSRNTITVYGE